MPIHDLSRHLFIDQRNTAGEQAFLEDRVPYRFRPLSDTQLVTARQGITLYTLASRYYAALVRPAGLWWVIADFQPQPIHDPTVVLALGRVIHIPSQRVVTEEIMNASRARESFTTVIGQAGLS